MRTLSFLSAALVALPAASTAEAPQPRHGAEASAARPCASGNVHHAQGRDPVTVRRLGELPPGNLELAVLREVDGCREPVIVRHGIGAVRPEPRPERR